MMATGTQIVCVPVPRALSLLTDGTRMFVTSGVRDQVTGRAVLYLNNRAGNRAFVRDLLADRQPGYAAVLEQAAACTW
jgi:hypothetical protein